MKADILHRFAALPLPGVEINVGRWWKFLQATEAQLHRTDLILPLSSPQAS